MAFTAEDVEASVGARTATVQGTWSSKDALLYALAVGAGQDAPFEELEYTTENGAHPQKVLPSFVCVAGPRPGRPGVLEWDMRNLLHGAQSFQLFSTPTPDARVTVVGQMDSVYDKGSAAVVNLSNEISNAETGELIARTSSSLFIRGAGGWGGERGQDAPWERPDREPDEQIVYTTRTDQALLYRLTGDRNPLHSDPGFAKKAGFDRPILHGMCTYGFTARALLHSVADSNPDLFGGFSARFSKTVLPGDTLTVSIWRTDDGARFQTSTQSGEVVVDRGVMTLR